MMGLMEKAKFVLKPWVEGNVYLQYHAFSVLYHCPFMLPHDADYHGVSFLPLGRDSSVKVLDVGANLGLSALSFRKLLPGVKVLSLEPNPIHERALAKIRRRDSDFEYMMVGAGREAGEVLLHVPYYRHVPLHTMASVDRNALEASCEALYRNRVRHIRIRAVPIRIIRIDDLHESPALIKIDAEGFESAIMAGALETIRRARPFLLIENNPASLREVRDILGPLDYRSYYWNGAAGRFSQNELPTRNIYLMPAEKAHF